MTPLLLPPAQPYRGLRGLDAFGGGGYGAPRSAAEGAYPHRGLDFASAVGDSCVAPCPCTLVAVGVAYLHTDLASIHLHGIGDYADYEIKLLYAKPTVDAIVGSAWAQGAVIGTTQSVAGYWQAQHPERGHMVNHLHTELRLHQPDGSWRLVDPTPYFAYPSTT
jgi:hypothetical protein